MSSPSCCESSTSLSERSTTASPAQTPIHGDSSSTQHSTPVSVNSSSSTTYTDSASSTVGAILRVI